MKMRISYVYLFYLFTYDLEKNVSHQPDNTHIISNVNQRGLACTSETISPLSISLINDRFVRTPYCPRADDACRLCCMTVCFSRWYTMQEARAFVSSTSAIHTRPLYVSSILRFLCFNTAAKWCNCIDRFPRNLFVSSLLRFPAAFKHSTYKQNTVARSVLPVRCGCS